MFVIFSLPNTVFGWFEYVTSILKIVTLILFVIVGLAMVFGAGPEGTVHHGEAWQDGSSFLNGFKGFGNSVLLAILSIGGMTGHIMCCCPKKHMELNIDKLFAS
jgi:amino acid transporter